tara:strand:- start:9187 stop:10872 length:1686 start_codon:yes stop_codon:yes gene_type:complete
MSYTKPQRIIDRSFDAFIKGSKDITNQAARTAQTIANNNARSKKEQAALQEKRDDEEKEMYDKANTFGSTGDAALDENVVGFWNDKVDEYFQIKNAMQNGTISRREGNLALSRIEALSGQFKSQAAYLAGQVSSYRDDSKIKTGAPGSISSVSSQESQQVLNTMMEGGNVQIVERGGVLYYYTPDTVDENGNVTKKGAMLNGSELTANASTDKDLYNKVQDISKLEQNLFNKALNVDDIVDETYIKTISETKDGKIYKTRQITDPDLAMETILESPGLDTIVGDNDIMTSYFQDVIPDEGEDGYSLTEYYNSDAGKAMRDAGVTVDEFVNSSWGEQVGEPDDPKNETMAAAQEDAAKRWIANDTLNKNTPGLNSIKGNYFSIENAPKPEKPEVKEEKGLPYSATIKNEIVQGQSKYDDGMKTVTTLYQNGEPTAEEIVETLNNAPYTKGHGAQDYWVGAGKKEDEDGVMVDVDPQRPGEAGMVYGTGNSRGFSLDYFTGNDGHDNLNTMYLGQIFKNQETIDHFNNNQPKFVPTAKDKEKIAAAKPGENITLSNGYTITKS